MSTKYLGETFDIHGGGLDLKFPHHEDEIAQSCGSSGKAPANFWMHANMLNVNGKKMSKSLGNFFLPEEIVEGSTALFDKAYSPNVLRFFMMQSHYRSTLDLTQEALNASEKGLTRLTEAMEILNNLPTAKQSSFDTEALVRDFYKAMNDDFNAPILIAALFDAAKKINLVSDGQETINETDKALLISEMQGFVLDVLGLTLEGEQNDNRLKPVMDLVLELRQQARSNKDWGTSDLIRDGLKNAGITVKDGKESTSWQ
jgi:cysteinyl-tRNA synthetase